ncbi:FUN14 domain containing 1, isoform CRA_c [Rattus norvegicus]|uniref:FUN14 domain containing 1, isoform CRA_c n=1 Tax=Rattus norvegicus TaxID=10116 RepID=A6JZW5_RAT|nr:FUN14 domain containing 1, isoform CRA_c [Rattus norvegicus]
MKYYPVFFSKFFVFYCLVPIIKNCLIASILWLTFFKRCICNNEELFYPFVESNSRIIKILILLMYQSLGLFPLLLLTLPMCNLYIKEGFRKEILHA